MVLAIDGKNHLTAGDRPPDSEEENRALAKIGPYSRKGAAGAQLVREEGVRAGSQYL